MKPCPRCPGRLFLERQLLGVTALVCYACGYYEEEPVAMVELAEEEAGESLQRRPYRGKVPL